MLMRIFSLVAIQVYIIHADIPGIPAWAQDLARCAPGGNSKILAVRGLKHDNDNSGPLIPKQQHNGLLQSIISSGSLLPKRIKRMGYAKEVTGGIKKWPFVGRLEFAELQNWFPKKHMISNVGTLIAPDLLLTARHVIDNIEEAYQKKVTKVYFGSNSRWTTSLTDTTRTITDIYFFPNDMVDLAILRLNSPLNCSPVLKVAALVPLAKDSLEDVVECKSVSWGKDENGQCPQSMKTGWFKLYQQKNEYEVCARGINHTLTNVGDSGMPLMCKHPKTEEWYQYGIFIRDYWAGDFKVSCFVSVPYCYKWIEMKINQLEDQSDIEAFRSKCPSPTSFD